MRHIWIVGTALLLCACAESEDVVASPEELNQLAEAAPTAPAAAANALEEPDPIGPAMAGQWVTSTRSGDAWAGYGPPNSEAAFSVRCDRRARRLVFSTSQIPPEGGGATTLELSAEGVEQSLGASASEVPIPNTQASVETGAQWLESLAAATGNLSVRAGASEPVVIPLSDQLASLISDCGR